MSSFAVLHITSVLGGGVDRYVRDIARGSCHAQLAWHVAHGVDVMESPAELRFIALDSAAIDRAPEPLAAWLRARRVGLVHAHAIAAPVCERTRWAAAALGVRYVATLHDILFIRPDAFEAPDAPPDPAWLARTGDFLRGAAAVIAPSEYLARRAREALPGLEVSVVPNSSPAAVPGKRVPARAQFLARRPAHVAAMIGAIGPHKGSEMLEALAAALEGSDIAIVVIGYLDRQVLPGWRGDHVFVHGAYDDDEVAPLLAAYGAQIALFPNQVPESFSYTLSDAWIAGVPALVAPTGALAERVERHAGGWLLPQGFGAAEVASALRRLLGPDGAAERSRVKSQIASADPSRVPSPEEMTRSLDALYERYAMDPGAPPPGDSPELSALIAKNVNGALFRQELVRLADEMAQMRDSLEALDRARVDAGRSAEDARRWGEKVQSDVASLQEELRREVEARRAAADENAQLRRHKRALEVLPRWLRRVLMKISDGRS
jgi:glycosyltransferase involved in cell wall biosynthesis